MPKPFRLPALLAAVVLVSDPESAVAAVKQEAPATAEAAGPDAAFAAFMEAFNAMDMTAFTAAWTEDASIFYPEAPFPVRRVEGREAVVGWFGRFFDLAKSRGRERLTITPQNVSVQTWDDMAVASFHLEGGENIGRRTLVLRRQDDGRWLIVHMHASTTDAPAAEE